MDTDILNSVTDCKAIKGPQGKVEPCHWWYEIRGICRRPANIECPEGVRQPQQESSYSEFRSLT